MSLSRLCARGGSVVRAMTAPRPSYAPVRSAEVPVTFTVPLKVAPLKVTLDPHYGLLRK